MARTSYARRHDEAIGRRVRRFRDALGWSLEDVVTALAAVGVTATTSQISKFERGALFSTTTAPSGSWRRGRGRRRLLRLG